MRHTACTAERARRAAHLLGLSARLHQPKVALKPRRRSADVSVAASAALRRNGVLRDARACAPHAAKLAAAWELAPLRIVSRHVAAKFGRSRWRQASARCSREWPLVKKRAAGGAVCAVRLRLALPNTMPALAASLSARVQVAAPLRGSRVRCASVKPAAVVTARLECAPALPRPPAPRPRRHGSYTRACGLRCRARALLLTLFAGVGFPTPARRLPRASVRRRRPFC